MTNGAYIRDVVPDTPADDAGFVPGCIITSVDGQPLRDAIDWQWLSSEYEIELGYVDTDGDAGTVVLEREMGEEWGFVFTDVVFDKVRTCRNACTFCFMRQLPPGLRATLTMRDDDFRLSFFTGTFITLTNLDDADIERILEQHISPLRVSLHAVDADVRRGLIGKHAQVGLANLERLLDGGIEFDAQIVLVPHVNDGAVLQETLAWAYDHPGIKMVGIVPLGFTRYQDTFDMSFDSPADAAAVIDLVEHFQRHAMDERETPWVYAADEFYRNAYGDELLERLPNASFYGGFSMFEDGIGIIRSAVDDFAVAVDEGIATACADALKEKELHVKYFCGYAMTPYIGQLMDASPLGGLMEPYPVQNDFFGGNVNVTGLLTGQDIARAITVDAGAADGVGDADNVNTWSAVGNAAATDASGAPIDTLYLIPEVIFNVDGLTLDDWTLDDIKAAVPPDVAPCIHVTSVNPIDYMNHVIQLAQQS